jgi:hypothetical protein
VTDMTPAIATCLVCSGVVPTRTSTTGVIRLQRHTADPRTGVSCQGTGQEIQR